MDRRTRYLHPLLNSERWNHYWPRADDIVIATPFKSGTTWMQMIVLGLLHGVDDPPLLREVDHWIDFRLMPLERMIERLETQSSRRFIKTHLPFDAIPYHRTIKYIVVDRDPRDVFMSLWNHYRHMDVRMINRTLSAGMEPIPSCPKDIRVCWKTWLTRGYGDRELEGYPFWSNLRHVRSWFDAARSARNIHHVHYNDLLADSVDEIGKVAAFLDVDVSREQVEKLATHTSFDHTKTHLDELFPDGYGLFEKGADTFFHRGTNGRWRGVLTNEDLNLLESVSNSVLGEECAVWLVSGASGRVHRN